MESTTNTFLSVQPDLKESYSDGKKKKRFSKVRKAMAELDASKNPMKFMKDNIEPSLKGKRGIAV
jgi:hypothetical protein